MTDLIKETSEPLSVDIADELLAGAPPGGAPWKRLEFTVQRQEQSQWCWAAVSVSIADFYERPTNWTQCRLVCDMRQISGCCEDGSTPDCNQPWYLDKALDGMGALRRFDPVSPPNPSGTLPTEIEDEIDAGQPVGVRIGWRGGGGHVIVVEGCSEDGAMVAVEDPLFGASDLPAPLLYDRYQGTGRWTHTYLTKDPA
jgi:Papain-like cysteine protease AvrRpt2